MIDISEVRVRLIDEKGSKLKGVASISFAGCFVVHDIKIIEGNQGLFLVMPSRKTPNGTFKDVVHPLNSETRQKITDLVFAEYEKVKAEQQEQNTAESVDA